MLWKSILLPSGVDLMIITWQVSDQQHYGRILLLSSFLVGSCTVDRAGFFLEVNSKGRGPLGTSCYKGHSS